MVESKYHWEGNQHHQAQVPGRHRDAEEEEQRCDTFQHLQPDGPVAAYNLRLHGEEMSIVCAIFMLVM